MTSSLLGLSLGILCGFLHGAPQSARLTTPSVQPGSGRVAAGSAALLSPGLGVCAQDDARPAPSRRRTCWSPTRPMPPRLPRAGSTCSDAAADLLRRLSGLHGLSACSTSPAAAATAGRPMCFSRSATSSRAKADVHLGRPGGRRFLEEAVGFWMSASQYADWKHTHRTVDVVRGRAPSSSTAPEGVRFLIRSRLFTAAEAGRSAYAVWPGRRPSSGVVDHRHRRRPGWRSSRTRRCR